MISDSLIYLVNAFAYLFFWVVVLRVVLSWLIGFNVVNGYNPYVRMFQRFADSATEPLLGPIRRALPDLGGLDISPLILLIALEVVRRLLVGLLLGQPLF
jgi:YggT family protein